MSYTPEEAFEKTRESLVTEFYRAFELAENRSAFVDKTLLSLSSGALVFSMTFVEKIAPSKQYLPLLFAAWAGFTLSMIAVLLTMKRSQASAERRMHRTVQEIQKLDERKEALLREYRNAKVDAFTTNVQGVAIGNLIATGGFIIGIVLLGIFVGLNIAS